MSHDCDNCQSKGTCDIEPVARDVRKAYVTKGVVGLLGCVDKALHQPPPNGKEVRATIGLSLEEIGPFNTPVIAMFREGLNHLFHDEEALQKALGDVVPSIVADTMDAAAKGLEAFGKAMKVPVQLFDLKLSQDQMESLVGTELPTANKSNLH